MINQYQEVYVSGYVYQTEQAAIDAVQQAAIFYDYPEWTQYWPARYNDPEFWFILADDSLIPVYGDPINFSYLELIS